MPTGTSGGQETYSQSIQQSIQTLLVTLVVHSSHCEPHQRITLTRALSFPHSLTFVLWLRAGDDPFDQAALHQSFPREPRFLPLPRILNSAWCRLDAVGISQQAAIDHLAICLEGGEELGNRRERERETAFKVLWKLNKPG